MFLLSAEEKRGPKVRRTRAFAEEEQATSVSPVGRGDPLFSPLRMDTRYPAGTRELGEQENTQEALTRVYIIGTGPVWPRTGRTDFSRRAGGEERRTATLSLAHAANRTIGMRPNEQPSWRYSFVPMDRESGPDDRQSYLALLPPPALWIGQWTWLGRDDALKGGRKIVDHRGRWFPWNEFFWGWWKWFGIVDLLGEIENVFNEVVLFRFLGF